MLWHCKMYSWNVHISIIVFYFFGLKKNSRQFYAVFFGSKATKRSEIWNTSFISPKFSIFLKGCFFSFLFSIYLLPLTLFQSEAPQPALSLFQGLSYGRWRGAREEASHLLVLKCRQVPRILAKNTRKKKQTRKEKTGGLNKPLQPSTVITYYFNFFSQTFFFL